MFVIVSLNSSIFVSRILILSFPQLLPIIYAKTRAKAIVFIYDCFCARFCRICLSSLSKQCYRSIRWSIGSIGSEGEHRCIFHAGNSCSRSKSKLLISSALSFSRQMNDRFSAGQKSESSSVSLMRFQDGGKKAPDLSCFAGKLIGQKNRLISKVFGVSLLRSSFALSESFR